jgi:glycosyltransferase involved in cell wall biosynthesis
MTARKFRIRHARRPQRVMAGPAERGALVSIIICNHNREHYLGSAIDSALRQSHAPIEVVVIDDGSTDGSPALIRAYGDRIKAVLKRGAGQPSAINAGFRESRGEIICLLEAEDRFAPDKVARLAGIFARNPDAGWIFHELGYIDDAGREIPLRLLENRAQVRAVLQRRRRYGAFSHVDLRDRFAAGERLPYVCPGFSALSFRRHVLDAILPMPEDIARSGDEFPKFAALALFPGIHLGDCLAQQRIHGADASAFGDTAIDSAERVLKTAYHLRHRYRHIAPSTDKWFASSFGRLLGVMGPRATMASVETKRYLKDYFGPLTWMRQGPRIVYHAARGRLGGVRR